MQIDKLKKVYNQIDQKSNGRIGILQHAISTFSDVRASQASAGLAYYAFFSLFPLLLLLISGASYFLDSQKALQMVNDLMNSTFPMATQLINENLQQVLKARGAVGLIGIFTLLWSASGVFTNLGYNINLAWPQASRRNYLKKRLVGIGIILELGALLLISLLIDYLPNLLSLLSPKSFSITAWIPWNFISLAASWLMVFILFMALYRWIPTVSVDWTASLWSAAFTSLAWKIATGGFRWYLTSGFGRYQLVYGSLGAIAALFFLIYLMANITLFGAHLSAAIQNWKQEQANHHK